MTALLEMSSMEPAENLHGIGISFTDAWGFSSATFSKARGSWLGIRRELGVSS